MSDKVDQQRELEQDALERKNEGRGAAGKPSCPTGHPKDFIIKAQVIEPTESLITGAKFWLCGFEGCGRIWDEEGSLVFQGASQ